MEKLSKVALGIAVLALLVGGFAFFKAPSQLTNTVTHEVGANPGPDVFAHTFFHDGITNGGGYFSTTTVVSQTSHTLTQANLNNRVISMLVNREFTLNIGATSTVDLIPHVGDTATVYLRNASTTAASTITLAAVDSSTDLQFAEATGGDLVLSGLDWGRLTFIRNAATGVAQVTVLWEEETEAD